MSESDCVTDEESNESVEEKEVIGTGRGQLEINWYEVVGQIQVVDSREKVKHIKRSNQLFVTRMLLRVDQGFNK